MLPRPSSVRDTIRINDLLLTVPLLAGAIWPKPSGQPTLQPVLISFSIPHDISSTASTDDLSQTINYSLLCSLLRDSLNEKTPPLETLEALSARIFDVLFLRSGSNPVVGETRLRVVQSRAPLNCKAVGVESVAASTSESSWTADYTKHFCEDLECSTIIGVNAWEREERQNVRVNITIERWGSGVQRHNWVDFRTLTRTLHEVHLFIVPFFYLIVSKENRQLFLPDTRSSRIPHCRGDPASPLDRCPRCLTGGSFHYRKSCETLCHCFCKFFGNRNTKNLLRLSWHPRAGGESQAWA
jgi:dihydroneopterin aldolase